MGNTLGTALNKVKVIAYCPARIFLPNGRHKKTPCSLWEQGVFS